MTNLLKWNDGIIDSFTRSHEIPWQWNPGKKLKQKIENWNRSQKIFKNQTKKQYENMTNETSKQVGRRFIGNGFEKTNFSISKSPNSTWGSRSSNQEVIWRDVKRNISSQKKQKLRWKTVNEMSKKFNQWLKTWRKLKKQIHEKLKKNNSNPHFNNKNEFNEIVQFEKNNSFIKVEI